jgi:hypothetical protein
MIVLFAEYLVANEYKPSQISILSLYSGQLQEIRQQLKAHPNLTRGSQKVIVTTLDNYQGEENDIVLLSLVRNNDSNSIGFLKIFNRVCVSMSRARNGLFIFGNSELLKNYCLSHQKSSQKDVDLKDLFWLEILRILEENNNISNNLALKCTAHKEIKPISSKKDLINFKNHGCKRPCGLNLACGHPCNKSCHRIKKVSTIELGYHEGDCGNV